MLEEYVFPHLGILITSFTSRIVPTTLDLHEREFKCYSHNWPPRSPDLTVLIWGEGGVVNDSVYFPPFPTKMVEMKNRIREAIESITQDMLAQVSEVCEYV